MRPVSQVDRYHWFNGQACCCVVLWPSFITCHCLSLYIIDHLLITLINSARMSQELHRLMFTSIFHNYFSFNGLTLFHVEQRTCRKTLYLNQDIAKGVSRVVLSVLSLQHCGLYLRVGRDTLYNWIFCCAVKQQCLAESSVLIFTEGGTDHNIRCHKS